MAFNVLRTFTLHLFFKVMINSVLEITESEYHIKLNRKNFNLSFIRSLLTLVEVATPSDDELFIPEKRGAADKNHSTEPGYFTSLEEK